ncbi:MAG: ATP-dependent helicase [Anaerococcus sp.]|nr:ATP-dependent helicase [Anaerococcus sp.]
MLIYKYMKLTDQQIIAANHLNGPCLVLAVPGSGKTTMLLERIKILSKNVNPSSILSLTFSRSQAIDMKERFNENSKNFMTIHAFCYLIIRNFLKKQNKQVRLLESDQLYNKYNLVADIYFNLNQKKISKEDLRLFFSKTGYMKNAMLDTTYLDQIEIKNVKNIYQSYETFKKENHYIDFDDMQIMALALLDNQNLLRLIKKKYKYFQLDEGQDTSLLQFKILEKIIYPENNLLVVADDDQSIYSFRAADPSYLLNFKERYKDAKILSLDHNHRSQKNIISVANKFIKQNKNRYAKNLLTTKKPGSTIKLAQVKDSKKLYEYIIANLNPDKKTAILYRNNISAINLITFLLKDNIAFNIVTNNIDFFESKMFDDLIKIIKFSEDFNQVDLFKDIYYKIRTFLTKDLVEKISLKPINQNVFDFFYEMDLKDYQVDGLMKIEKEMKHIRKLPISRKISFIYTHMGYQDYANLISKKHMEETYNKEIFIESMVNFTQDLKSVEEISKKISYINSLLKIKQPSKLTLSTIHASKGLEYDDVFVIDLVKNEFPIIASNENYNERLEEERRIFYVAMTRAKENLHLITLKYRNKKKVEPSIFYTDIKNM